MIIKAFLNMQTNVEKWSHGISSHTLGRVLDATGGAWDTAAGEARQRRWTHRQEQWSVGAEGAEAQSLLLGAAKGSSSVLWAPSMARDAAGPAGAVNSCTIPAQPCTLVSPMNQRNLWTLKYCLMLKLWDRTRLVSLRLEQISCFYCRSFWLCLCRSKENCCLTFSCGACSVMGYI